MDADNNIYAAGVQYSPTEPPSLAATPGAFQAEPDVCNLRGGFPSAICAYQYVVKLNSGLDKVQYATYLSGTFGETPAAISVDAAGQVTVAGTTYSLDYPTTAGAYEPVDPASAPQSPSCFFIFSCIIAPTPSGYVSVLNSTGTGLVSSTFFGGTQTDTINFASILPNGIYLSGTAHSADLPGLTGVPQQCLPQSYETRLSADTSEVGRSRIIRGKVLAYDGFAGKLIATTGTDVIAIDPNAAVSPIACVLDAADLKPVSAVAPGELVSLFGEFGAGNAVAPNQAVSATTLNGVNVNVNGTPSPLLYVSGSQINFQIPTSVASAKQASIQVTSSDAGLSASSPILNVVASNPTAFLNVATPSLALATCNMESSATLSGLLPLALNPDGSVNSCLNPAPLGSNVILFLNGLGTTTSPTVTTNAGKVISVSAIPNAVAGLWEVAVQTPSSGMTGGLPISLSVSSVPVRDTNLVIWVK